MPSSWSPRVMAHPSDDFSLIWSAIWHFTLYWTLILIGGVFLICSLYAMCNLLVSLVLFRPPSAESPHGHQPATWGGSSSPADAGETSKIIVTRRYLPKKPPLWPTLLIPVVACLLAGLVSVITATVIGFALAAVYSAGGFSVSTWVPFLWALIQLLVIVISSYSTLTTIL